ncbi:MAG TPA: PspC domain-containing protein [Anaerolineaceae bacterium]|nr:PspC domain-containing protein [Anaerolineaceae bacterium]
MNQIVRSKTDRMIGGVCGGIAHALRIDPVFVRLFFVLLAIGEGIGVLLYLVLWLVIPEESAPAQMNFGERARDMGEEFRQAASNPHPHTALYVGGALILLGAYYLLRTFDFPWLQWINQSTILAFLLIVAGIVLLLRFRK